MIRLAISVLLASTLPAWPDEAPKTAGLSQEFCASISDKATDARLTWETNNLNKLQAAVAGKLTELEAKQRELQDWAGKREQMLKAANQSLVDIYAKMDPEAAAAQLGKADSATAASILRQLSPRGASAILNIMEPDKAAALVKIIAAAAKDAPAPGGGT